ncbi:nucleotidyltransferase domain-containing protein [Candidatus Micrarchaeota archaeon]|nr:nucleotidyltransferase domain-containing protein [Candidatus Micrarchaeota archaeon]
MNDLLSSAGNLTATEERRRLLRAAIGKKENIRVGQLAKDAKTSKGLASAYVKELQRAKIIVKGKAGFNLNDCFLTRQVKRLENISRIDAAELKKLNPKTIILYGSWAEGTNTRESDVDLCVVSSKPIPESKIATVSGEMSRKIGAEVHILLMDEAKKASLKNNSTGFYYNLAYKSILLEGERFEA